MQREMLSVAVKGRCRTAANISSTLGQRVTSACEADVSSPLTSSPCLSALESSHPWIQGYCIRLRHKGTELTEPRQHGRYSASWLRVAAFTVLWPAPPRYPARAPPRKGKLQQGKVPSSLRTAMPEPSVPPSRMRGAPWLRLAPTGLIRLIHRVRRRPWHVPHVASLCLKRRHPKPSSASDPGRSRPSQSVPGVKGVFASKIRFLGKTIRGRKDVMIQQVKIVFVFPHQSLRTRWTGAGSCCACAVPGS